VHCVEDYLRYALVTFPVHITGWLHDSLATAALLHAVGVGPALAAAAPGAAPALTAAAKWVLKDGLGAAGRLAVAGRVAGVLDASPRQWRLYGSMASLLGGALEIVTAFASPQAFLPLAAGGTALKACAKAVAAPSHAALMAHFATPTYTSDGPRNLGALSAKEEVQEVAAQLAGLAVSVSILSLLGPDAGGESEMVALFWTLAASSHFLLRCFALRGVKFRTLNARRASAAAFAHAISREAPERWASVEALNAREPLLTPDFALPVCVHLGCSLSAAIAGAAAGVVEPGNMSRSADDLDSFLRWSCTSSDGPLAGQRFLLTWRGNQVWVVFTTDATPADALRAIWLAVRLTASSSAWVTLSTASCLDTDARERLVSAVADMHGRYTEFEAALDSHGWDVSPLLPPPSVAPRVVAPVT
jgi:Vitamin B6 photo-protection and homoeostasis